MQAEKIMRGAVCALLLAAGSAEALADTGAADADFHLGGAVRFNYGWRDDRPSSKFQPELVRLDARGHYGKLFGEAQYRWYDGFDAVHHAFVGWKFNDHSDIRAGVVNVPFGLLPYAAQTFWFNTDYYLGLDDDYDAGIVWQYQSGAHQWHAGAFFGDEYGSAGRNMWFSAGPGIGVFEPGQDKWHSRLNINIGYFF